DRARAQVVIDEPVAVDVPDLRAVGMVEHERRWPEPVVTARATGQPLAPGGHLAAGLLERVVGDRVRLGHRRFSLRRAGRTIGRRPRRFILPAAPNSPSRGRRPWRHLAVHPPRGSALVRTTTPRRPGSSEPMKITAVTTHLLSANWAAIDEQWADTGSYKSSALVRIETDAGITGLGEIIIGYFAPEAVPTLVEYFIPHLIGKDPLQSGVLWNRMYESSKWWGRSGAAVSIISGIDIALWDIRGKALGAPVHTLLGGLMHDRMPVYASIGGSPHDLDEAVTAVRRWVDEGFRAVKLGQFSNDQFTYDV